MGEVGHVCSRQDLTDMYIPVSLRPEAEYQAPGHMTTGERHLNSRRQGLSVCLVQSHVHLFTFACSVSPAGSIIFLSPMLGYSPCAAAGRVWPLFSPPARAHLLCPTHPLLCCRVHCPGSGCWSFAGMLGFRRPIPP